MGEGSPERTVVGYRRFNNKCGSHHQSQVKSCLSVKNTWTCFCLHPFDKCREGGAGGGGGGHLQTRAAHNRLIPYLRGLAIPLLVSCQSSAASVGQICRLHLTSHDSVYSSHLCLQELQHPQCEQLRPFSVLCPVLKEGYNT